MLKGLLKTLRPKQWIKNLFVAAPLVFAQKVFEIDSAARAAAAVALFCLISGCVYVVNDIVDVEKDKAHPKKKFRPIPSGELPINVARAFVFVAVPVAVGLGALLSPKFTLALAGYFVLNLGYCFVFKNIAYLDVFSITAGFLLRVTGGAWAIDVPPSPWLLVTTAALAMFLGFGKRAHELMAGEAGIKRRKALAYYSPVALEWIMHTLGSITVTVYVLYTQSDHVQAVFGDVPLIYTVPFPMIGILRFNYLVTNRPDAESPTEEMLRDPLFIANLLLWLAVTGALLYGVLDGVLT